MSRLAFCTSAFNNGKLWIVHRINPRCCVFLKGNSKVLFFFFFPRSVSIRVAQFSHDSALWLILSNYWQAWSFHQPSQSIQLRVNSHVHTDVRTHRHTHTHTPHRCVWICDGGDSLSTAVCLCTFALTMADIWLKRGTAGLAKAHIPRR